MEETIEINSRVDLLIFGLIAGCIVILLYPVINGIGEELTIISIVYATIAIVFSGFLLWLLGGTFYKLTPTHLGYQSGPMKGMIPLEAIHTIIKGETMFVGFKPATARNGLVVKYGKYDDIYISPISNEFFIAEILKRNPKITIVEKT